MLDFSVIIPTYNRPQQLARCLVALAKSTYPAEQVEIIVVDDGGRYPLAPLIDSFRPKLPVQLVEQANAGPALGRNAGAAEARGRFLAFTDDDCAPDPTWLMTLASILAAQPDTLVGGHTHNALQDNLFAEASQCLIDFLYHFYVTPNGQPQFFTSNNMALAAEKFHQIGGFDQSFGLAAGEDRDFCNRWHARRFPSQYAPQAIVRHYHNLTPRSFWRQHLHYGMGAAHFHQLRAKRQEQPVRVEPLRFYFDLVRYPLRRADGRQLRQVQLSTMLLLAQVANLVGFTAARLGKTRR